MTTKSILLSSILLCLIALPVHAELSDADLDKIRLIVKEEVKSEITASETRMKEYISQEIKTVNVKINETDKRLSQIFWVVIALIGFIGAAIGVPQWLTCPPTCCLICPLAPRLPILIAQFGKPSYRNNPSHKS